MLNFDPKNTFIPCRYAQIIYLFQFDRNNVISRYNSNKMKLFFLSSLLLFLASTCGQKNTIDDLDFIPETSLLDKPYENVFKMLDGEWKGVFKIYEDKTLSDTARTDLESLNLDIILYSGLVLIDSISVHQKYSSESPYFQRVEITDYYPKTNIKEVSKGVNKIQDGKMYCIVKKPTETIIHQGKMRGKETIIWSSYKKIPLKREYFQETVTADSYEIIGYGYYDDDDEGQTPRLWFYGNYARQ